MYIRFVVITSQSPVRSSPSTTSAKPILPSQVTFIGSRDEDLDVFGGHYSATLTRRWLCPILGHKDPKAGEGMSPVLGFLYGDKRYGIDLSDLN